MVLFTEIKKKANRISCFVSSGKLAECLMKTAKVNKQTLLVKGNIRTKKKAKRANHDQSGRMNYWTMTCAKANNKRKKSQRREKSTWGFWFAEMQFHWRKKPNGLESENEKKKSTLKCVLTRRIVFPIYETHKSATTLLWKNALSPFFSLAKWKSRLFIVDGEWNWWRQNTRNIQLRPWTISI